jgi:hypothetical protein
MAIESGDQFRSFAHCCDVGGDIERVGQQQQEHDCLEHKWRERDADICSKPFASDPTDPRAQ